MYWVESNLEYLIRSIRSGVLDLECSIWGIWSGVFNPKWWFIDFATRQNIYWLCNQAKRLLTLQSDKHLLALQPGKTSTDSATRRHSYDGWDEHWIKWKVLDRKMHTPRGPITIDPMGRKKSKRTAVKKVSRARLDTSFACPFCNEESSVECKLYTVLLWVGL